MKCSEARTLLSQLYDREEPITLVLPADLEYLSVNGYVLKTTKDDYEKGTNDVARLSQMITQVDTEKSRKEQAEATLQQDERKEHSFVFRLEGKDRDELRERIQEETTAVFAEESELTQLETTVNQLIQEKSTIDRMVAYDGIYLSLTGLGTLVYNDLGVRYYRVADDEFPDFIAEIKATYAELRSIADNAASYVTRIRPQVPEIEDLEDSDNGGVGVEVEARSLLWSTGIGLGKLQGNTMQLGDRFIEALNALRTFNSTLPNKLMAAEIMTAMSSQDILSLESTLRNLDQQLRKQGVPKEQSAGVAATIMAGRRFDGTYPIDRFAQVKHLTKSSEAASILAVMNVPIDGLSSKFQEFRSLFTSWGYMTSEDTEIASAFLAIGELNADEVEEKLKYILEQLQNYLQYPIVAAAILASIPVFEAHEVLDLMEKAVTLLTGYGAGLERSEVVTLAVRMIHGVRNEIVKEIDPTAKITNTPVQFTYGPHPGFFVRYYPVIIAHSSYHATFSGMGGFHPAHSHGVGGFAG
ncbi:hypothetical protein E6H13_00610 [Candidatus Bathyarchaeota archaeon]|nr:MAG: hypothetical protein E6H13_00610 [Candidatus Bathyarchaeota archaeon]